MFGVDERSDAAVPLRFSEYVQSNGGFAAAFRAEYFDDAPARDAADAKCHVQRKDAGRDHFHRTLDLISQTHYGAVAEFASDLVERLLKDIFFGHFFSHAVFPPSVLLCDMLVTVSIISECQILKSSSGV